MTVRFSRLSIAPLLAALALVSGCGGGSGAAGSSTESGATVVGEDALAFVSVSSLSLIHI